jgi:hypothetical protein
MKNLSIACFAALALGSVAHAQFTFKHYEGGVISNPKKPDLTVYRKSDGGKLIPSFDCYYVWEKEFVKVQRYSHPFYGGDDEVVEFVLYYEDFDLKAVNQQRLPQDVGKSDKEVHYNLGFDFKKKLKIPTYTYSAKKIICLIISHFMSGQMKSAMP